MPQLRCGFMTLTAEAEHLAGWLALAWLLGCFHGMDAVVSGQRQLERHWTRKLEASGRAVGEACWKPKPNGREETDSGRAGWAAAPVQKERVFQGSLGLCLSHMAGASYSEAKKHGRQVRCEYTSLYLAWVLGS
ncbi:hypothetical protein B0T26DRAFT_312951 [Lasiosphaeria miniovina]|uniref:Uncharacterized protein n=1 Tax=Lasiosphaeria miniovina TaxID=1954250 RepID=A0AA40ALP3_9PEZI|nr:uncharacterized protein B0T26DRAFT_312951 [Lasiosphaeria miniovina]KAK0718095.1 hypothetical protein B0T26DRAFT_312951 [Lasiosphaeria miniovina]